MSIFSLIKEKGMSIVGKIRDKVQGPKEFNVPVINKDILATCIGTRSSVSNPMPGLNCPNGYATTELVCKDPDTGKISIINLPATFSPKPVMDSVREKDPENFRVLPIDEEKYMAELQEDVTFRPVEEVGDMRSFAESFLGSSFGDTKALGTYMDPALIDKESKLDISLAAAKALDDHLRIESELNKRDEELGLPTMTMAGTDQYVDNIATQCEMLEKLNEQDAAMEQ